MTRTLEATRNKTMPTSGDTGKWEHYLHCNIMLNLPQDIPLLQMRVRHHCPGAWQQHHGVLRGQPGEGGCSLRWWQHWQTHRNAAAAGQCRPSPADWICAALSGHPAKRGEVTFWPSSVSLFVFSLTQWLIMTLCVLTLDLVSTLAPFFSRYRTTSAWPALAAMWRAVSPRWKIQRLLAKGRFSNLYRHVVH